MAAPKLIGPLWSDEWILSSECARYITDERRQLARELWELRDGWPHRHELRAAAAARHANLSSARKANDYTNQSKSRLQRLLACADAADLAEVLIPNAEQAIFA